jgi:hypothetical protein
MRTIQVSTDVFAAIWAARSKGEGSEDEILRNILGVGIANTAAPEPKEGIGFRDPRYGVEVPEGFEIYRTYLGKERRARATGGLWLLDDGTTHPTVNELSEAIGVVTENAWKNWFFTDSSGRRQVLSSLRDPARITQRRRVPATAEDLA